MPEPKPPSALPLRFGQLKQFARAPVHFLEARAVETVPTPDMERGSGVHAVVLGTSKVTAYPGKQRRGKEWEAFEAEHAGEVIVTAAAYERVMGMAEAIWSDKQAMDLLFRQGTVAEKTLLFDHMGKHCRATPDVRHPDYIVEVKSSSTTEPEKFTWQCQRMLYHAQLAFYLTAAKAAGVPTARDAYVVGVESAAPYPVTILRLSERTIDQGDRAIRLWFERLLSCEAAGFFPGYVQTVIDWDIEEELHLDFADGEAAA